MMMNVMILDGKCGCGSDRVVIGNVGACIVLVCDEFGMDNCSALAWAFLSMRAGS